MNIGLILAAGKGRRFGADKAFAAIAGESAIMRAAQMFEKCGKIDAVYIAVNASNKSGILREIRRGKFKKTEKVFLGGNTRFKTVKKFFKRHNFGKKDNVVIHNVANPFAEEKEILSCLNSLRGSVCGAAAGRKIIATVKQKTAAGFFTLPRKELYETETPQAVRAKEFSSALKQAPGAADFTDDLALLENAGYKTVIIPASSYNKKITFLSDLAVSPRLFWLKGSAMASVGIGEDSHRFKKILSKKPLILGGVKVKNFPALEAESDGDVILHAVYNAVSSALGGGSIGKFATVLAAGGIYSSREYIKKIMALLGIRRLEIRHVSISIEAARPKIDPLAQRLKKCLSGLLKIPVHGIGITATTGEKLSPFGKGLGIKCTAVVLLG